MNIVVSKENDFVNSNSVRRRDPNDHGWRYGRTTLAWRGLVRTLKGQGTWNLIA